MVCPKCSGKVMVIDNVSVNNDRYRKRRCVDCKHVFFTAEFEVDYEGTFKDEWNSNHRAWRYKLNKKISNFKKYKLDSLKTAKELFYDDDILESIQAAETVGDVERCLICGRKRRDEKYGI